MTESASARRASPESEYQSGDDRSSEFLPYLFRCLWLEEMSVIANGGRGISVHETRLLHRRKPMQPARWGDL
jgi:hypothetical protein